MRNRLTATNEGMPNGPLDFGAIRDIAANEPTLDAAYRRALAAFPGLFIYRGGHHIAIHDDQNGERKAIITEAS